VELQSIFFYLAFALLPLGLGAYHLLKARYPWGALFVLMGAFNGLVLMDQIALGKLIYAFTHLAAFLVAMGALFQLVLPRATRWVHEFFAMASLCLFSVMLFDVGNIRAGGMSDDMTGFIAGLIGCLVVRAIVPRR